MSKYYDLKNIVASTIQTAIADTNATHLMTSLGSTLQYALSGYSLCNSVAASGFMDILGTSDYPPLYRISLPGNCGDAAENIDPPVPLGENQNVRLKCSTNLNVTGTLKFIKERV